MKNLIILLFALLVIVPLLHRIFEIITLSLSPRFFIGVGMPLFKKQLDFSRKIYIPSEQKRFRKEAGNFIFTEEGQIYAYPRLTWSGFYSVRSFFALRMLGEIRGEQVHLSARISGFTIVYAIIFLAGLAGFTLWSFLTGQDIIISLLGGGVLLLVILALIPPVRAVNRNYDAMIDELIEIIKENFLEKSAE